MKGINETIGPLARVEPGAPGAHPSDAGARALLASITAEPPGGGVPAPARARRRGPRRVALGLGAAAVAAAGVVVGPSLLNDGALTTPSYAVTKDSDGVVWVKVRGFRDVAGLTKQLRDLGVPAIVDYAPPGKKCREPRATYVEDIPQGLYDPPRNIPGEKEGWQMRIDTRLFKPGQTFVWTLTALPDGGSSTSTILMEDPVKPCVLVPDVIPKRLRDSEFLSYREATAKGRSLAGYRVGGKTVGEVVPEIEKRGLKVAYWIIEPNARNLGGYAIDPRRQNVPVGKDWTVWEAEESTRKPGLIRLLVTREHLDWNPVYGDGSRDNVIKE
ncbi:hypothetical protein [Microbispora catharanthi]|uniref:Uncharacterized protein n=1 Tax=Microbispora catharanthi TaxID=1712871 RepID=A0A5N6BE32_9ACTN|nr:hypothetical protein [Microbispora catharanthi]KAB8178806.1 hypothetical protein FH610_036170 [Microbispora catharanthi]